MLFDCLLTWYAIWYEPGNWCKIMLFDCFFTGNNKSSGTVTYTLQNKHDSLYLYNAWMLHNSLQCYTFKGHRHHLTIHNQISKFCAVKVEQDIPILNWTSHIKAFATCSTTSAKLFSSTFCVTPKFHDFQSLAQNIAFLNPGVGNHPVITYTHLSQVDRVA